MIVHFGCTTLFSSFWTSKDLRTKQWSKTVKKVMSISLKRTLAIHCYPEGSLKAGHSHDSVWVPFFACKKRISLLSRARHILDSCIASLKKYLCWLSVRFLDFRTYFKWELFSRVLLAVEGWLIDWFYSQGVLFQLSFPRLYKISCKVHFGPPYSAYSRAFY